MKITPGSSPRLEAPETGAESRTSISPRRQAEGVCRRLQRQVGARQRARDNRQCRASLHTFRRQLETTPIKGALERRKRGATIISCATGLQPRPCSSPRGHPSRNSLSRSQSPSIPQDANDSAVFAPSRPSIACRTVARRPGLTCCPRRFLCQPAGQSASRENRKRNNHYTWNRKALVKHIRQIF